jgi:ferredoxin
MGPISLSFAENADPDSQLTDIELAEVVKEEKKSMKSIHSMTTDEWRAKYEKDGAIDLWVEEEFNAGSRLVVWLTTFATRVTWMVTSVA